MGAFLVSGGFHNQTEKTQKRRTSIFPVALTQIGQSNLLMVIILFFKISFKYILLVFLKLSDYKLQFHLMMLDEWTVWMTVSTVGNTMPL